MNQEQIGKFIAELRKENKMTQEQLAEKIGVTNKSISRWENGKTMPDLSIIIILSDLFNVEISELLNGRKMSVKELQSKRNLLDNLIEYESNQNTEKRKRAGKIIFFYLVGYASLFIVNRFEGNLPEVVIGILLTISIMFNIVGLILAVQKIQIDYKIKKRSKK